VTDVRETLLNIIRDLFGYEELEVTRDTIAADIDGWDSLGHINVIIAIEEAFDLRFATAEIGALKDDGQNIGVLIDLIESKLS
jgi:acyl carrier protein